MVSELGGEAIHAVLPPPQLERFRVVTGLAEDEPLRVVVRGWHKIAVVAGDVVFLFPRAPAHVEGLRRELTAYRVLAAADIPLVPRIVGEWDDDTVHPFPFAAVTRLAGEHIDDPVGLFGQVGAAIATWHELDPPPAALAEAAPPPDHDRPHQRWLHRALDASTTGTAAAEVGASRTETEQLAEAASLDRVLVHGDIHEDQLLAVGDRLTGVLDWETARIDHPFFDFDLGEWGTGLWRDHGHELDDLSRRQWATYAAARRLDLPAEPLLTAFRLRQTVLRSTDT